MRDLYDRHEVNRAIQQWHGDLSTAQVASLRATQGLHDFCIIKSEVTGEVSIQFETWRRAKWPFFLVRRGWS